MKTHCLVQQGLFMTEYTTSLKTSLRGASMTDHNAMCACWVEKVAD